MNEAQKISSHIASQYPHTPASAEVLLNTRLPGESAITNDGKRVAFTVWEPVPGEQKRRGRIWLVDTAGGEAQPLTSGKRGEFNPSWSPDGQQLAFVTQPEGEKEKPQLHTISAQGGEPKLLCKLPNGVSELSWSPDGSRIAFISLEGDEPKTDPKVLAPDRYRRLWIVRPDQAIPEPVTPNNVTVWEYTWSPDSQQLALYYSHGPDETDWYHSEVGVISRDGGAVRQLTNLTWQARGLAWSPDSKQIAYLSGRWSDPGRGAGEIFVVSLENRQSRNLTPDIDCSPAWCSWLADGRYLLFAAVKGVTHQISLLDTTDGSVTVLEKDFAMQWDQPTLSITPDRQFFSTVHSTANQPPDVWYGKLATADSGKPASIEWKRLTRLNPIVEETLNLSVSERISFESSDGQRVYGIFLPPPHLQPGELPPLYVDVHGGPSGADCDNWAGVTNIFTAAGYAVLTINYRGSWGQGRAFADAVLGDMGGKDLQDILSGVEYLVQHGKVDGERVCIGGWSNGGYLSAWAVTQTHRFKAAMVGAGISDWSNMHAQTNIADADMLLLAADPLENPAVYSQHSPLTFAGKVKTPTLILHGENDPAVPVAQAYAFYRALRERNVPVECAVYPREGHGLSERDHVRDSIERQLSWFARYVK